MTNEELKDILAQQMKLLLEKSKQKIEWCNTGDELMKLSIGMSNIAKAIIDCNEAILNGKAVQK